MGRMEWWGGPAPHGRPVALTLALSRRAGEGTVGGGGGIALMRVVVGGGSANVVVNNWVTMEIAGCNAMTTKRRARQQTGSEDNGATTGYESQLWQMADALRGSMDAAEYKHVVLGLLFLKYVSDAFEEATSGAGGGD